MQKAIQTSSNSMTCTASNSKLIRGLNYKIQHTVDPDEQASCLTNWKQQYNQLSAGRFIGKLEELYFDKIQLFSEIFHQSIYQQGNAWPGSLTIAVPMKMRGSGWFNGRICSIYSMLLIQNDEEFNFRTPHLTNMFACTVDMTDLTNYATKVRQCNIEKEFANHIEIPIDTQKAHAFGYFLNQIIVNIRNNPEATNYDAVREEIKNNLYDFIINVYLSISPKITNSRLFSDKNINRGIALRTKDYMLSHIEEPLTIARICADLGISQRALQQNFINAFGLSPIRVLRALRLNCVRRALKDPSNTKIPIADIAARWGFWHPSYFSARYKELFGELPSETCRSKK